MTDETPTRPDVEGLRELAKRCESEPGGNCPMPVPVLAACDYILALEQRRPGAPEPGEGPAMDDFAAATAWAAEYFGAPVLVTDESRKHTVAAYAAGRASARTPDEPTAEVPVPMITLASDERGASLSWRRTGEKWTATIEMEPGGDIEWFFHVSSKDYAGGDTRCLLVAVTEIAKRVAALGEDAAQ